MAISQPIALLEDERVLVNRYEFAPGDETGHHVHGLPYVIVPLTDGVLRIVEDDGTETEAALTAGVPYSRPAGVSHNVRNGSAAPLVFLEIEIKT
jgi:beta-alanine degradation protein BauB